MSRNVKLLACLLCCCSWVFANFKNDNENARILSSIFHTLHSNEFTV